LNQELITVILLTVFSLSAIGVILIGSWMYRNGPSSSRQARISRFVNSPVEDHKVKATPSRASTLLSPQNIAKFRDWINETLSGFSSDALQLKLSSAYWTITDTEYILIRIVATGLALFLGLSITRNIIGGILLAAITIFVFPMLLDRAIAQRQQKFHNQLLDVLILITGAVKAGYSLMQALDLAVKEIPDPASEEFGRVLREIRLGISLEGTLFNLAERMSSDDMQIVVTAIIVNSQVGGNLSTVLESTISTIRDRMRLTGEIRSLTSYARYVGNFLSLMPLIMSFLIFLISPGFFAPVRTSIISQVIILMALFGIVIGNIWIRQIVKIKV
jgi:tight adherence protein B